MQLSGCLKVQINNNPPQILSVTNIDFFEEHESGNYFNEDSFLLAALMSNLFSTESDFDAQFGRVVKPSLYIGKQQGEMGALNYMGYTFDSMLFQLADAIAGTDEALHDAIFDEIISATPATLQSIIDKQQSELSGVLSVNTKPSVIQFMRCTTAEIDELESAADGITHKDMYAHLLSNQSNNGSLAEMQGYIKALHNLNTDCIVFHTQCSFTLPKPAQLLA